MAKVVSKLDLNKTPQLVDNNSLIFAKNIRVLKDGIIGPDFPIDVATEISGVILGYIVGLDSTLYLFTIENNSNSLDLNVPQFYDDVIPNRATLLKYSLQIGNNYNRATYDYDVTKGRNGLKDFVENTLIYHLGGTITRFGPTVAWLNSNYPFATTITVSYTYKPFGEETEVEGSFSGVFELNAPDIVYNIYAFDEKEKNLTKLNTAWHWSGGKIHGVCTTNNTGDIILTVCEYFEQDKSNLVPIKHINLSHSDVKDESIYTQTPNIPFTNLTLIERYVNPIPAGVYQFFIRYKIYKDFYTDWFPCSGECFAGTKVISDTIQGSIQYIDTTLNSNESFVFSVKHLFNGVDVDYDFTKNFKEFQLGFIVSHDDSINARAWKHFPMTPEPTTIYFDYNKAFITEINIDDLLKSVYEINNVKNITYFRNKLYISNYIESDINENLSSNAFDIDCTLIQTKIDLTNQVVSDGIVINGHKFPVIPGTDPGLPTLYNLGYEGEYAINEIRREITSTPQDFASGSIFKAYYKVYAGLDPDIFFLKSGVDYSINNSSNPDPRYAIPNVINSFSLYPVVGSDNDDFEDISFYNNQIAGQTSDNAGKLLLHRGDHYYVRTNWVPNTSDWVQVGLSGDNIYTHPLNDIINWVCAVVGSGEIRDSQTNEILGNAYGKSWYICYLEKIAQHSNAVRTATRYTYDCTDANWDEDTEEEAKNWYIAEKYVSNQLLTYITNNYPKYVLKAINIISENNSYPIINVDTSSTSRQITNIEDESTITVSNRPYNDFRGINSAALHLPDENDFVNIFISNLFPKAIDADGNTYYYDADNDRYLKIDRIEVKYCEYSYDLGDRSDLDIVGGIHGNACDITREIKSSVKEHTINIYYNGIDSTSSSNYESVNIKSLVPFTDYKFYVHYLKSNGVVTNGYPLDNGRLFRYPAENESFDETLEHSVIYPKFDNITLPDGYVGCFFSIEKVGNDIASCFNHRYSDGEHTVDCLEIDSMLYPLTDNITIIDSSGRIITKKARYYSSSTTQPPMMLGNVGCIKWNDDTDEESYEDITNSTDSDESDDELYPRYWVQIINKSVDSTANKLIKLTPYLKTGDFDAANNSYNNYNSLNIPGYYCSVYKPKDLTSNLYVNGSDVYIKSQADNTALKLDDDGVGYITHVSTPAYYVYSNFNLSYLSLFDMSYKRIQYKRLLEKDSQGATIENYKQMLFMLDSSTISYIYTLPSMYKDYTRKLYSAKQDDKLFVFDNVVRSSDTNTDEFYKYIYKFDAVDYYTVPANKGKIVNLFNITQNIFIHCEHGLFKFSGSNTLSAKDTEVQLTENDVFDTGITELFDAQYGFAGLQHKEESLVTFNAYIFYDSIANIVYGYFGENNLVNISESIHKLIKNRDINRILFTSDVENDRFFMNIIYNDSSNICLSFNFNLKSFTSIHDFNFDEGFYSRINCYFLDNARRKLYTINKIENVTNYSNLYKLSKLFNNDMYFDGEVVENCLDVVCNVEYEKVKVLNYINWICNQINKYADDIDGINLFVAEENISKYAGSKLRIYSDQCSTDLIELEDTNGQIYEQNNQFISTPESYKYPRYNCGIWSLNYFRDIKNNIATTDDKSLIYGKYFVLRLIFRNKNFKLENINFNIQNYEKV